MNIFTAINRLFIKYVWHYKLYLDNKVDKEQFGKVYENTPHAKLLTNECIFVLTGKSSLWGNAVVHGGLADRLKGIVSIYAACKETGRHFVIVHTYPYLLESYLIPNKYDWIANSNLMVYNLNAVTPHYQRHSSNEDDCELRYQKWRIKKLLRGRKCVHFYSNAITVDDNEFRQYFNELFKPAPQVKKEIDRNLKNLGESFISLSFRFTHLLGDPVDTYLKELPDSEKESLINKLIICIDDFHAKYIKQRILINSDSVLFLSRIRELKRDFIYIIPGEPVHIDQNLNASKESYLKTFVDFFIISMAEKVFLVKSSEMRNSGFPKCAAIIGNKPFEIVNV